jgi:hypothetical protein
MEVGLDEIEAVVAAGGESPDAPAVCRHAVKDHDAAVAGGMK